MSTPSHAAFIRLQTICALALFIATLASHGAQAWTYRVIHDFCSDSCYDGNSPAGGLTFDPAGNLYGATLRGGVEDAGTVFELVYDSGKDIWSEKVLYNFCAECEEGGSPRGRLVLDTAGNLYGTTAAGGTRGDGTIFRLSPNGSGKRWSLTRLYDFCTHDSSCPDGKNPTEPLTYAGQDSGRLYDGVSPLYGATDYGGKEHYGTVFSVLPVAHKWRFDLLYTFCRDLGCKNGRNPEGLLAKGDGDLVVATERGDSLDGGAILTLPATDEKRERKATPLYRFCHRNLCRDGAEPIGVARDVAENIFGTTYEGGTNIKRKRCGDGCGTLYQLTPEGARTSLYNFCDEKQCADGSFPDGALAINASGNLFGLTQGGGNSSFQQKSGYGTAFAFSASTLETLYKF